MISSAIWNEYGRVNFSKTNQSARAGRASALCGLWKICKCLFIPNCTRKIMWLLINNINEKHNYNNKFWQRAFLVHSTDWLKQTTTFVKFKLFQDQRFQNHSAKNLEMCKDWFYMITSLLKITRFLIISKSKCL